MTGREKTTNHIEETTQYAKKKAVTGSQLGEVAGGLLSSALNVLNENKGKALGGVVGGLITAGSGNPIVGMKAGALVGGFIDGKLRLIVK